MPHQEISCLQVSILDWGPQKLMAIIEQVNHKFGPRQVGDDTCHVFDLVYIQNVHTYHKYISKSDKEKDKPNGFITKYSNSLDSRKKLWIDLHTTKEIVHICGKKRNILRFEIFF